MIPRTQQWFRVPAEPDSVRTVGQPPVVHATSVMPSGPNALGFVAAGQPRGPTIITAVRPWIEPAQSFEKNQLGLGQMFFNSLRLTWQMSLWTDGAVSLR